MDDETDAAELSEAEKVLWSVLLVMTDGEVELSGLDVLDADGDLIATGPTRKQAMFNATLAMWRSSRRQAEGAAGVLRRLRKALADLDEF